MHRPCSIPLSPDCPDPSRLSSGIRYPPALLLRSALRTAILGLSVSDTPPRSNRSGHWLQGRFRSVILSTCDSSD